MTFGSHDSGASSGIVFAPSTGDRMHDFKTAASEGCQTGLNVRNAKSPRREPGRAS
ncbi:hypothetical protein WQQ_44730 [Hydrocarboniphaga effusa AP103]|uniref:Uncharacterized protein n=1 Tax=Hydrocarboniphaga effusa AP103 TaxID=1172194 RepID=I8T2X8_9GAMM|nr:hypothetical protein WQQ_44730 [Hydrocarboniphaga effusa AP103]